MHVQKFEHACSSCEQHAKIAAMLTWDFFKIPYSEWNIMFHMSNMEKSHVNMQHLFLMFHMHSPLGYLFPTTDASSFEASTFHS
jgi:hypothetical protein